MSSLHRLATPLLEDLYLSLRDVEGTRFAAILSGVFGDAAVSFDGDEASAVVMGVSAKDLGVSDRR